MPAPGQGKSRSPAKEDPLLQAAHAKAAAKSGGLKDAGSRQLSALGKKAGNDHTSDLLRQSTQQRDNLLQFIKGRLATVQQAQSAELKELKDRPDWWRLVGQGKAGFKMPDPTRWKKPAAFYLQAAQALAAGNLGRASDLLKRAVNAEKEAFQNLPKQVNLDAAARAPAAPPEDCQQIESGAGCPEISASEVVQQAEAILRLSETPDAAYTPWLMRPHHWWESGEEEDEKDKKKGGKDGKKAGDGGEKGAEKGAEKEGKGEEREKEREQNQDQEREQEKERGQEKRREVEEGSDLHNTEALRSTEDTEDSRKR